MKKMVMNAWTYWWLMTEFLQELSFTKMYRFTKETGRISFDKQLKKQWFTSIGAEICASKKNRIISTKSGQFQSGLLIFKTNRNTNRNLMRKIIYIIYRLWSENDHLSRIGGNQFSIFLYCNRNRDEQNRRKEQPANTVNGNQKSFGHLKGAKTIAR